MSDDKRDTGASPASDMRPGRTARREPATIDVRAEDVTPAVSEPVAETPETMAGAPVDSVPDPAPEPPPATPHTAPVSSNSSFVPQAVAGLVGAVIALVGAAGWQQFNASSPTADPAVAALDKRIATVETRLTAAATAAAVASLEKRIAAAEVLTTPTPVNLAPIEQRLAALEKPRPAAPAVGVMSSLPPDLDKRLATLEAATAAPKASDRAMESRIEATPTPPPAPSVDIKPLEARIAAVEQRLQPLQSSIAGSSEAAKAATAKLDEEAARSRATAQAIAAQSLQQALERGAPLKGEIDTLTRLGVAPDRLAPLAAFAASGAPSAKTLASSFATLADKLAEPEKPAANAGVMDRLSLAAQRLVRVRPAGEPTGTSPNDLVARIETALAAGNIAGAMSAWELFPASAKTASADWAAQAKARLAADTAARALVADALAALGRKS
ncbi:MULTISPECIES: hypothetical protein [unclassified Beijerinckia]|uniref:COG4223 family protein n=1 Tax=unclassified Beijerinckia TaxID=2638183 RepID=UPI00089968DD|nr:MULTISPECIES: hypothetical protein [unclassified Beijerinckia]MDH7798425.1 hypothetical protein [Beijerinckia sp. GAS462]SED20434.1 hypothetical protein SAMN05443249_4723 [Beijerinckia sp. 28-YEA-48]